MICGREQNRVAEGSRPPTKGGAGARAARALRARNPYKTGKSLVKVWEKYRKSRGKYRKSIGKVSKGGRKRFSVRRNNPDPRVRPCALRAHGPPRDWGVAGLL